MGKFEIASVEYSYDGEISEETFNFVKELTLKYNNIVLDENVGVNGIFNSKLKMFKKFYDMYKNDTVFFRRYEVCILFSNSEDIKKLSELLKKDKQENRIKNLNVRVNLPLVDKKIKVDI